MNVFLLCSEQMHIVYDLEIDKTLPISCVEIKSKRTQRANEFVILSAGNSFPFT